jgi:predicted aspartyl protease
MLTFVKEYGTLPFRLQVEVEVKARSNSDKVLQAVAIWDTGATITVISPKVQKELGLIERFRLNVSGVNNKNRAVATELTLVLPGGIVTEDVTVAVCNLPDGIDMLLGLDVILRGDFMLSNGRSRTRLSYTIPPLEDQLATVPL